MDTVGAVGLAELGYLERELSWSMQQAARKLPDDDLLARVRDFGEEHARHAEEIDRILHEIGCEVPHVPEDFKRGVHGLTDDIGRSEELASILVAMVQAERRIVDFYQVPLAEQLPAEQAAALKEQQREEQRHVDFLESRGAVAVPELADLGDADGNGGAEEV